MLLYDEAITEKFKKWCVDTPVQVYSPEQSTAIIELLADKGNDKVKLPIISILNTSTLVSNPNMNPLVYDGVTMEATYPQSILLNAIPIEERYQVTIYGRKLLEVDEIIRNLWFNLLTFPKIEVVIPYQGKNYIHYSAIKMDGSISTMSSPISSNLLGRNIVKKSLSFRVDDAYLWDVRCRQNYRVFIDVRED